jgi:photosystem II stability/assembly factor-like uncharacterized protein
MPNVWVRLRVCAGGLMAAALLSLLTTSAMSEEKVGPRDREIADIEKQIEELNKKLAELKKENSRPTAGESLLSADWIKALTWRSIGPAAMGGRITAISVFEGDPSTYFVATASGGLLKTVNNGVTFEHQFDRENTVSIGDVCVAPSDRNIVWVGTGENNPRNSVSYGDGLYKSTDGGKTWKNMGLKKSFQIGRIAIHSTNPNVVYVGALGRLYGPNTERGLFKTTNGGETWEKILYVDDKTGVIDMRMHPTNPETLLVATYERQRDGFDTNDPAKKFGPGSGLYKTTDGGKTFKKLTTGLPACALGRIGIDYYRKDPNTVFVILESEKIGTGPVLTDAYLGVMGENVPDDKGAKLTAITPGSPAEKAGLKTGDTIVAFGDKTVISYDVLGDQIGAHQVGNKVKVKLTREGKTLEIEVTLAKRPADAAPQGERGRGAGPWPGGVFLGFMGESVEDAGIKITRIVEGSPAEKAGLKEGDLVTALGGKPMRTYADLMAQLRDHKAGDKVKAKISRAGKSSEVEITLTNRPAGGGFGGFGGERPDPNRRFAASLGGQTENVQARQGPDGFQYGGIYQSTDGGETWTRINSLNPRPMYFSQIRVDPSDSNYLYVLGVSMYRSSNGGKTFRQDGGRGVHPDQHALWIDPKDGRHMVVGCDGGFYVTYDRMATWDHLNHLAIGQFYHVAVDTRPRYFVYGGLQDNGSWGGPSHTRTSTGAINEDWLMVGGGDGFVCQVDPNDPDLVYYEMQNGGMSRRNLRTGETGSIRPTRNQQGPQYRFNWKTPFILSHHNSRIFYCAGNYVFRSLDRGNDLRAISPEITKTDRGSASALSESPRNPNVLYVGTDDGNLWVTRDGGKDWVNVTANVGLKGPRWVATIEASRFEEGRAYVVFDGHRSDDDDPLVYVTEDFGKTWKSLRSNLPWGSTRCLREDIQNPNLLFLGTEFAAWASIDRGTTWTKLNNNLPTVAIHDYAIHPTAGEIVAATHGRSFWVLDVTPLRQMTPEVLKDKTHLYRPNTATRWRLEPSHGGTNRRFVGQNPSPGACIYYSLAKEANSLSLKVVDYAGKTVRELNVENGPGLHKLVWDLTLPAARPARDADTSPLAGAGSGRAERGPPAGARAGRGQRGPGGERGRVSAPSARSETPAAESQPAARADRPQQSPGGFRRGGFGQPVSPGMYRVILTVDGQEQSQSLRVEGESPTPTPIIAADEADAAPTEVKTIRDY